MFKLFKSWATSLRPSRQNFTALEPNSFRCSIASCDGVNASFADLQLIPIINNSRDNESEMFDESLSWTNIEENYISLDYTNIDNTNNQMCYKPMILPKNDSQFPLPPSEQNCSFLTQDVITGTEKCNFWEKVGKCTLNKLKRKTENVVLF